MRTSFRGFSAQEMVYPVSVYDIKRLCSGNSVVDMRVTMDDMPEAISIFLEAYRIEAFRDPNFVHIEDLGELTTAILRLQATRLQTNQPSN